MSMNRESVYSVYLHIFPNGKVYVGITGQKPHARWGKDGNGYKYNRLASAIAKYGWNNIQHRILFSGLTSKEAGDIEKKLIAVFCSSDSKNGYNAQSGGWTGHTWEMSEEGRNNIRRSKIGSKNPMYGKKHTPEWKAMISEINTGKKLSEETLTKMRAAQNNRSEETLKRMSDAHEFEMTSVIQVETGRKFKSVTEASKATGVSPSNLVACCKGRRHTTGGYHWCYD